MILRLQVLLICCWLIGSQALAQTGGIPTTVSDEARSVLETVTPKTIEGALTADTANEIRSARDTERAAASQALAQHLLESVEDISLNGVPAVLFTPRNADPADRAALMYIHGGGYVLGEASTVMAIYMAAELGVRTYSIQYRLAPEHPYPAGLDDCVTAYRALVDRYDSNRLVMAGTSAGGGLTLATILRARDEGLPMPAAAALVTPWCDLSHTGDAYFANDGRDPILTWTDQLDKMSAAYAGGRDPREPLISPLYADFTKGFPPSIISTGTRDLLLSDCVRLHQRMRQAGVRVDLAAWEGMWHAFQLFDLPEAEKARAEIARFLLVELRRGE